MKPPLASARVARAHAQEPWLPAFMRAVDVANSAEDREIVDGELFWGNDRLEMALDHCLAASG